MTAATAKANYRRTRNTLARALAGRHSPVDATAPIRAGMRARAIADACEQMALPAILVDAAGRVLHVAPAARAMMGEGLDVRSGHLVGGEAAVNHAVAAAVTQAVGDVAAANSPEPNTDSALTFTGLPYHDPSPYQLLRGIVVLGRPGAENSLGLGALRAMLAA